MVKINSDFIVREFIFMLNRSYTCASRRNMLKTIFECEIFMLSVMEMVR